jgi:hypothetical protein
VLGYVYISSRKFAPALKVLEEALALHPDKTHFFPAVAFCHYRMENLHELRKIVQLMTQAAQADQYLEVCRDGFLEKAASMPGRLDEWMQKEKIPHIFIQRDPNLNLILGN